MPEQRNSHERDGLTVRPRIPVIKPPSVAHRRPSYRSAMSTVAKRGARRVIDVVASTLGWILGPALRGLAMQRGKLPRFQKVSDRFGYQLRSTHYYEPAYALADLPADTKVERTLPGVEWNEAGQLELLASCRFGDELAAFPLGHQGPTTFGYRNRMFEFGDAEMLYNVIRLARPARLIEVGCGSSTLMAQAAIRANRRDDPEYRCDHVCIEPYENHWLESLDVTVERERIEHLDLDRFSALAADDIVFIDSSHVVRPFGDVLRLYQEILPLAATGVWVHIHDIFTPRDYPETWLREYRYLWNEQYLVESFLAFNDQFEVVSALNFLHHHYPDELHRACPMLGTHRDHEPSSLWLRRV